VIRQVARRLAKEAASNDTDDVDLPPDLFAQVQAEAGDHRPPTFRACAAATACVPGATDFRCTPASCSDDDRGALERLCRYGARPAFDHTAC
jgi:hypothetical protein